ncbi:MAG: hypothetical protein ACRDGQ_09065 [Candidatus Limnocylindrales bacterium]
MSARTFLPRSLAIVAVTVALAACGAASTPGAASQPPGGGGAASQPPGGAGASTAPGSSASVVTGHVGDKLSFVEFGGDPEDATLVKVFDPATPNDASEAPLPSGIHWVGVEVILNDHGTDYQSNSSEINAVTSAGAAVTINATYQGGTYVLGDGFAACTQTAGSEQDTQPYTHCVAFAVPDGQTLAQVGVKVPSGTLVANDQVTWTVP